MDSTVAIVGCGPAGMISAISFARRGISTVVFEAGEDPMQSRTYNPDRSYAIDITGHGMNAIAHIDEIETFDREMIQFNGVYISKGRSDLWEKPGWIGSRGDIMRVLIGVARKKYADKIDVRFNSPIEHVDVAAGQLTYQDGINSGENKSKVESYDLIIAADGGGSVARQCAAEQVEGFEIRKSETPYFCRVIALDKAPKSLDQKRLHILSVKYLCIAGAINGDDGPSDPRWYCYVPFSNDRQFKDAADVRKFFRFRCPRMLEYASDASIESFASRKNQNIGRTTLTNRSHAGKVIFIGDSCGTYPPIGQGANAAMESASSLDKIIGEVTQDGSLRNEHLQKIAAKFERTWMPERDAVAWLGTKLIMTNIWHLIRVNITHALKINVIAETKYSDVSYSSTYARAKRMWPIWSF